jgi:hypothetical protein
VSLFERLGKKIALNHISRKDKHLPHAANTSLALLHGMTRPNPA